ncbi:MAG: DNA repair exonuclease [Planctomycetales bacterium]|nr:DNA repair exonuclease [Planctomycetales bacterium]
MSTHSVRFLHASDLHLELTLGGLTSVPAWLRDDFIDAPFKAAENVFNTAINENVDFVILAGDVLDIETAGPRAIDFLLSQFDRMREHKVKVYWCGGVVDDPDLWPVEIALPKHVHVFPTNAPKAFEFKRRDRVMATILGQSRRGADENRLTAYSMAAASGAKIAVAHGNFDKHTLQKHPVDYWALGGEHNSATVYQEQSAARYCGSPQGFSPDETGQHGCSIVAIEHGRASARDVTTQAINWHREPLQLAADSTRKDLEQSILNQSQHLQANNRSGLTLVTWDVSCSGPLANDLRNDRMCETILASISQKRDGRPNDNEVVSVAIELEPQLIADGKFEEETILGDFLRTVREYEQDPNRIFDLAEYLPETTVRHEVVSALSMSSPTERTKMLRRVAALGMELLSGETESLQHHTQ